MIGRISDRRLITYGFSPQADVRATNVHFAEGASYFDVVLTDRLSREQRSITDLRLPMPGQHNVQNALSAVAIAREMGFDDDIIRGTLAGFKGVKRRFTRTGEAGGITVIDDYGHHPVEIAAVLAAARQAYAGRVIAVVQPHRFSRLKDLFEDFCTCFNQADTVIVADVYAAGEAAIEGIDRDALVEGLRAHGHRHVVPLSAPAALAATVLDLAAPGDLVVCLGAGSITNWANALPAELAALQGPKAREARQ
jgi:UDP-N-acetylmuramate--alanine ligase